MSVGAIVSFIATSVAIYGAISLYREARKYEKLVEEMPAKIEQAKHEGWYEGYTYANACNERRHPRGQDGKFVSRT